jgi:hypothetical protein
MRCPKFDSCSAPICPFDPERDKRTYLKGEPVCMYMLEYVKPGGVEKIRGTIGGKGATAIGRATQGVEERWKPLFRRLCIASQTPSRLGGAP